MIKDELKIEFNTYCIFADEKEDVKEVIGLIFKDYLVSHPIQQKELENNE